MEEIPFSISSKPSNSQSPHLPVKKDCFFKDRRTCFSQTPPRSPHVLLPFSPSGLILVSLVFLVWGGNCSIFKMHHCCLLRVPCNYIFCGWTEGKAPLRVRVCDS